MTIFFLGPEKLIREQRAACRDAKRLNNPKPCFISRHISMSNKITEFRPRAFGCSMKSARSLMDNAKMRYGQLCPIRTLWGIVKMFELQEVRVTENPIMEVFVRRFSRALKIKFELAIARITRLRIRRIRRIRRS